MQIGEILRLRFEFEEIVSENSYKISSLASDIDSLYDFIESGHVNNRFREGFDRAAEIANCIIDDYEKICS